MSAAKLSENITAYDELHDMFEMDHNGEWVVIYDRAVQGFFNDEYAAIQHAASNFGRGPYLIRRIGESAITLPASVVYQTSVPVRVPES